ncbi:MAG: family N-acetyltransferase [Myxococcaceae bacterium]|nr:family N-acetyltransferase [Myxococcaceae bacterium]
MTAPSIGFRALTAADLPLLHRWLCEPHVVEWWEPAPTFEAVEEDYLPRLSADDVLPLDAPAGVVQFIAREGDEPFGYIQCYRVMAHQADGWWLDEADPFAVGIDQFIALPDRLGQGLGTRMLRAFIDRIFEDPRVTRIQTDPDPTNARAIAAYRKAGFVDVEAVETPNGPALLMRIDRGSYDLGSGSIQGNEESRAKNRFR